MWQCYYWAVYSALSLNLSKESLSEAPCHMKWGDSYEILSLIISFLMWSRHENKLCPKQLAQRHVELDEGGDEWWMSTDWVAVGAGSCTQKSPLCSGFPADVKFTYPESSISPKAADPGAVSVEGTAGSSKRNLWLWNRGLCWSWEGWSNREKASELS